MRNHDPYSAHQPSPVLTLRGMRYRQLNWRMERVVGAEQNAGRRSTCEGINDTSVINQIKEMAQRSELYVLRRAHGIYFNLVPLLRLRSTEALYLAGEGNSRIDVNVM